MTEPTKCPRCNTEGCPTGWGSITGLRGHSDEPAIINIDLQAGRACSQRAMVEQAKAQTEALRKILAVLEPAMRPSYTIGKVPK